MASALVTFYDACSRTVIRDVQRRRGRETKYRALLREVNYVVPRFLTAHAHLLPRGALVLDLGCADGLVGEIINGAHPHGAGSVVFHGLDVSPAMVRRCRRSLFYAAAHRADLSRGLPSRWSVSSSYDAVTAFGCLELIEHHAALFRQVHCVLKSGGLLLCSFEVYRRRSDVRVFGHRKVLHTQPGAQGLLKQCGFECRIVHFEPRAWLYGKGRIPIPYVMVVAQKEKR